MERGRGRDKRVVLTGVLNVARGKRTPSGSTRVWVWVCVEGKGGNRGRGERQGFVAVHGVGWVGGGLKGEFPWGLRYEPFTRSTRLFGCTAVICSVFVPGCRQAVGCPLLL